MRRLPKLCECSLACLLCAVMLPCSAQAGQGAGSSRGRPDASKSVGTQRGHSRRTTDAVRSSRTAPPTGETVHPGQVSWKSGKLAVAAENSAPDQVLEKLAAVSGLKITGSAPDLPVSGVWGPGNPREVLTQLLASMNASFIMIGGSGQAFPRELILAPKSKNKAPRDPAGQQQTVAVQNATNASLSPSEDQSPNRGPDLLRGDSSSEKAEQGNSQPLGPGAIAHVPPNEAQDQGDAQTGAARLQQHLQALQRMQDQQNAPH